MGTRGMLSALLAAGLAAAGTVAVADPVEPLRGHGASPQDPAAAASAGTDTDTAADTGADADADTGADTGADADTGAGAATVADADPVASSDRCAAGPLPKPLPDCRPDPVTSTGDPHGDCVARINRFRWECQCLPPLLRWTDGERCADGNAQYDSVNGIHSSFYEMPCGDGARAQNECPGWPSNDHVITGCLQAMWDEGPEDGNPNTVNGHYETMASTSFGKVACGFYTTKRGNVWAVQNFQ